ncbi:M23 family metallopeptidase [Umezakia ovalisporum]|uniref:M23 family metallopeptidase n=1 Tax=Umezakia ovalisporum TaxID=75695 RepID=UPI0035B9AB7C
MAPSFVLPQVRELYVWEGKFVEQGQVIAAVGCTGLCIGLHLHFEVGSDSTSVNPANL